MTYDAVFACAVLLTRGQILHAPGATASGTDCAVRDKDEVTGLRTGRLRLARGDSSFDAARTFVGAVGVEHATRSARVRAVLSGRLR